MADEADMAQAAEARFRDAALARALGLKRGRPPGDGTCNACGEPIPQARLDANPDACTCVDCQAGLEAAMNGGRR